MINLHEYAEVKKVTTYKHMLPHSHFVIVKYLLIKLDGLIDGAICVEQHLLH